MIYGTKVKTIKDKNKTGVLKFNTGKTIKLTHKEVVEFEVWVRSRAVQYCMVLAL